MTSQELFDEMQQHWLTFKENHERFAERGTKTAAMRARKSINELKKIASKYRSTQLTETKNT
jgi:hypothetical protein